MSIGALETFSDLESEIEQKLSDFSDKIQEALEWVKKKWDDSGFTSGWRFLSPGWAALVEHYAHKLEDAFQAIWDKFEQMCKDIWETVDQLFATPWKLMELQSSYIQAAEKLRGQSIAINQMVHDVGKGWEGDAFDSYSQVATEFSNALGGIDQGLTKTAAAYATGAKEILETWRTVISAILSYAGDVVDAIQEGTDAGKVLTLDTGPAIKVILDAAIKAAQLLNDLSGTFDTDATINIAMWNDLNAGLPGLESGNGWPQMATGDVSDIKDKGDWEHH